MRSQRSYIETRISTLEAVLAGDAHWTLIAAELRAADGDVAVALAVLAEKLPAAALERVSFVHALAEWSGDDAPLVKRVANVHGIYSMRDVASQYDAGKLAEQVDPKTVPAETAGTSDDEKTRSRATQLQSGLFTSQPSAVLGRMVTSQEIPITDVNVRTGVARFLANLPDFNIRTTSIYTALRNPHALDGIPVEQQAAVIEQVKILQCVQALTNAPEAVPLLIKANLTSAFRVAELTESTFLKTYGPSLGQANAQEIYTNAVNARIRNEHALASVRETMRGTKIAILDGNQTQPQRLVSLQETLDNQQVPLNLSTLFADSDSCQCDDCMSVYSAASYFVELLQFLRNNDLDPVTGAPPVSNPNIHPGIVGTPLEMLFRRRPDLGCLQLTFANTNTVLPYVDLASEVMESFIVHQSDYDGSTATPPQTVLDVFNVADETSNELLAQPQHTNYQAYCRLKRAVYPFTLPYHQPIDAIRIFLKYLGTSRYELIDTFRAAPQICPTPSYTGTKLAQLQAAQATVLNRAADAESLGLTQEEYIILCAEAFWEKTYFDVTYTGTFDYPTSIGVKPVYAYYGYGTEADMLSTDEGQKLGLTFVQQQFLPRTGLLYTDLVSFLETKYVNPSYPQGQALTILDSIRATYRYLQTLLDTDPEASQEARFANLIEYLEEPGNTSLGGLLAPDPCQPQEEGAAVAPADLENWVYCHFDRIGKLIVLELVANTAAPVGGQNVDTGEFSAPPPPPLDTCDLANIRLTHLDGSALTSDELDRIHRIIRLWRKLGWTIDQVDTALTGLGTVPATTPAPPPTTTPTPPPTTPTPPPTTPGCSYVGFDIFVEDCTPPTDTSGGDGDAPEPTPYVCPPAVDPPQITADFLHRLAVVKKLLDLTGLPLPKLLTFWADIGTVGNPSLYASLFLTHNMVAIDDVFQADANGNYLTQATTIAQHIPVLMAALGLKANDIAFIANPGPLVPAGLTALTLTNVTVLYRHGLLAKMLGVKVTDLPDAFALFGNPFVDADHTLALLQTWGRMQAAGFTFRQLTFALQGNDDPTRPLAPSLKTILELTRTLHDGLNAVDQSYPDLAGGQSATSDLVRASAGLLFEPATVQQIMGVLEGTTVYSTNAPASLTINVVSVPSVPTDPHTTLAKKLKYLASAGTVQVTGVLTAGEMTLAKSLSSDPGWSPALDRLQTQVQRLFHGLYHDALSGVFADMTVATNNLLAGDVIIAATDLDPTQPDPNTAPVKRAYFLSAFLPYLRQQLKDRFIVDTTSGTASLSSDVTAALLSDILTVGTPSQSAIAVLRNLEAATPTGGPWSGYLIPPADGDYTFVAISDTTQPDAITIAGRQYLFHQQDDPNNVWFTDPVRLKNGVPYPLKASSLDAVEQLAWKTGTSPRVAIPDSAVLPDGSWQGTRDVLLELYRAAVLINGFNLSAAEVGYFETHASDFSGFDWNAVTLAQWLRLQAYTQLRDSLPPSDKSLLDLFQWIPQPGESLDEEIAAVTGWDQDDIDKLIAPGHFDLTDPAQFRNEQNLVMLQAALALAAKIGMDIDVLFEWAAPGSNFWACHQIAEDIRKAIKAGYSEDDWEQVVKPLNDQLREDQRQALVSYLVVQPDIQKWATENGEAVPDADSLFEFFLIDVQMDPCMQTSRIKQAISTVQLFIQRCLFDQERVHGVPSEAIDRNRGEWMQKYRVWQANREVFLYPENWIEPTLRDDKSPFYEELEAALLQNDLDPQSVQDAVTAYLFKVDEVANLMVIGLFIDTDGSKLHIFGRTRGAPYVFYYRYLDTQTRDWHPWEQMQVDIPSYDLEDLNSHIVGNGTYLAPIVWNKRLLVFFPQLAKKVVVPTTSGPVTAQDNGGTLSANAAPPSSQWEIRLGWSEYRDGKWTPKQLTTDALYDYDAAPGTAPPPAQGDPVDPVSANLSLKVTGTSEGGGNPTQPLYQQVFVPDGDVIDTSKGGQASLDVRVGDTTAGIATISSEYQETIAIPPGVAIPNYKATVYKDDTRVGVRPKVTISADGKTVTVTATVQAWAAAGNSDASVDGQVQVFLKKAPAATPPAPADSWTTPAIDSYVFVPRLLSSATAPAPVAVDVYRVAQQNRGGLAAGSTTVEKPIGRFDFAGSHAWVDGPVAPPLGTGLQAHFQFVGSPQIPIQMHSWQAKDAATPAAIQPGTQPFFEVRTTSVVVHDSVDGQDPIWFYHSFVNRLIGAVTTGDLDDLFALYRSGYYDGSIDPKDAYGLDATAQYDELKRPYSIYNWELGFHAPMELADRLLQAQKLDDALTMCQRVFQPSATTETGDTSGKPYWMFPPFKEITPGNVLENLFLSLQPGQPNSAINEWRDNPFQPHLVARSRPVAYMKWVAMKYIEILIAYGDYYFTQNTLETVPLAIQLYVMASHLYGPRGQTIPSHGQSQPQTYNSLLDKWDAFGNAMVELELVAPFSNQTTSVTGGGDVAQANIFGSLSSLYFCIPDNPDLTALRDTIDDRLFKIRHCQDINGVVRQLPLFEPPINPALLVQAAAQGLSLSSVLDDLNSPMPNYRFYYLLQKALELCNEVKALGNAFVSTKEKEDGEALARLRSTQEIAVQSLVMEVRKQQLDEANKSLDALQQSRTTVENRMQYYLTLIGEDLGDVPSGDADFSALANPIDPPVTDGGIRMSPSEKEEMDKASDANDYQIGAGVVEALASVFHALPLLGTKMSPLGVGAEVQWGFPNMANALQAAARGIQIKVGDLTYQSTSAGRKAGFQRSYQDRVQQANAAGYELKSIDKQMLTQQVRIAIANQEIVNQQKQIDNALEVDDFLRNKKYTNQELFTWMADSLRTTYRQAYDLAYDIATKAEKTYRFEHGLTDADPDIIQYGYWNAGYDGILAAEQLYVDLKKLEAAHQENRPYDYEITRPISLRQIAPLALLQLRDSGSCEFALPEILFDMDYAGHYMRRIKSVALTVPCVIGPYTSLNCTLRLLSHTFRTTAAVSVNGNDYPMRTDESDDRFMTVNVPIIAIAVSTGQSDAGVFELNFRDERYIPFEGAGAISSWRIELPKDFRQFDYNTISDVVMHVRYTSVDGGDNLKRAAGSAVSAYVASVENLSQQQGLFAAFDLIHDLPNEWYKANQPLAGATSRVLPSGSLYDRLPIVARSWPAAKVRASDVYLVSSAALPPTSLSIAGSDTPLTKGVPIGQLQTYAINGMDSQLSDLQQLQISDVTTSISALWLVVRYVLE